MRFLNHLLTKLGFKTSDDLHALAAKVGAMTPAQHRLLMMAEQDVDLAAHPALQWSQRAQRRWDEGRREEALQAFDEALKLEPGAAIVHLNRGNLLFQMGRFNEALEAFTYARANDAALPVELFGNERMIRTLGPESPALQRLAARRAVQAEMTRGKQSLN